MFVACNREREVACDACKRETDKKCVYVCVCVCVCGCMCVFVCVYVRVCVCVSASEEVFLTRRVPEGSWF